MADLNALIAQGAQFRQPVDPFAQYAQMQQLQQGQQANQLNQMKMAEYQRNIESQNALRATAAPAGVNPQHWAIDPMEALKLQKTSAEAANLVSTGKKTEGEVKKQLMDFENNAKRDLSQNPSPENIQAYGQDAVLKGFATPEQAAAKVQQYLAMSPVELKTMLSKAGATAGELLTSESAKLGRATTERGQDITAATAKAGQESVAKTALAGQAVTMRGQNLLDTREKENIAIRQEDQRRKGDPAFVQQMASANTLGQAIAKDSVLAQQVLPKVLDTAEQTIGQIDNLIGKRNEKGNLIKGAEPHPGFESTVGASWTPGARFIPGTPAADFQSRFDQIKGGAFLQAFETLKGGGAISDIEGAKGSAALNRMSTSQSEKEFVNAAREFQDVIRKGVERAKTRVGGLKSTPSAPATNIDALLDKYK